MICTDTGIVRASCYCGSCSRLADEAALLRARKAHVLLAEMDERTKERELLHLDRHLRDLAKEVEK